MKNVDIDVSEFTFKKLVNELIAFFLYGAGVFAFLKVTIWAYSMRIFSFFYVWRHRHKFSSHPVFEELDRLERSHQINQQVIDPGKKQLAADVFFVEIIRFKQMLRMNLKRIYRRSFSDYLSSFKEFTVPHICQMFAEEFTESRHVVETMARIRLTRFGMKQDDFNRFWQLYEEMFYTYEAVLTESINTRKTSQDVYATLMGLLNDNYTVVRIINRTLAHKFNVLNGRAKGIVYKGQKIAGSRH